VPREYMDAHQLKSNARLRFEYSGDRLILSPIRSEDAEKPDAAAAPAESQEASETKSEK